MIDVVDDVVLRFRAKNAASQFKGSRDLINECGQQQELGEHAKGEEFKGRRGRKKGKTLPISKLDTRGGDVETERWGRGRTCCDTEATSQSNTYCLVVRHSCKHSPSHND